MVLSFLPVLVLETSPPHLASQPAASSRENSTPHQPRGVRLWASFPKTSVGFLVPLLFFPLYVHD